MVSSSLSSIAYYRISGISTTVVSLIPSFFLFCLIFFLAVIPVVRNISEPCHTQLSEPVAIFCLVTGYRTPNIIWQQDGWSLASGTGQNARVNILSFTSSEFESSDFEEGSGGVSISDLLLMNTDVTPDEITLLGELGVVSVLSIDSVVREDTGNYTCTATNQLPETRVINVTSSQVPLLVLGNQFIGKILSKVNVTFCSPCETHSPNTTSSAP